MSAFTTMRFKLRSRKDVDELDAFLRDELKATIVDPAGEYYDGIRGVLPRSGRDKLEG